MPLQKRHSSSDAVAKRYSGIIGAAPQDMLSRLMISIGRQDRARVCRSGAASMGLRCSLYGQDSIKFSRMALALDQQVTAIQSYHLLYIPLTPQDQLSRRPAET